MIKNLPANAGNLGLIPGLGRSHLTAVEPLSLCSATREATTVRGPHREVKSRPLLNTNRENPSATTMKTQSRQKEINKYKYKQKNMQNYCDL